MTAHEPVSERRCGNCRWWKGWRPPPERTGLPVVGSCTFGPVPEVFRSRYCSDNDGAVCPVFEKREESCSSS